MWRFLRSFLRLFSLHRADSTNRSALFDSRSLRDDIGLYIRESIGRGEGEVQTGDDEPVVDGVERTVHIAGLPASSDGTMFDQRRFSHPEEGIVTLRDARTCDFGHFIGYDGTEAAGRCLICDRLVCTKCYRTCSRCGRTVCRMHSRELKGRDYCLYDAWRGYARFFWGF